MKNKKTGSLLLALVMVLSFMVPSLAQAQQTTGNIKEITIFHFNDSHGRVREDEKAKTIGYPKLKSYVDSKPNSILLDAGDTTHGTTFAIQGRGENIVKLLNEVGVDAAVPGNHDFNYGYDRLLELAGKANYPILAADVIRDSGKRDFKDNTILEVDGVKVGVFGISCEETKWKSHPSNTAGVTFLDPVEVAKGQVQSLKEQGAEVIVGITHVGLDEASRVKSSDIAEKVEGIDVIVDGHSHHELPQGKVVNNTLIVQTGDYLRNLGEVTLFIKDGKVAAKQATLRNYDFFKDIKPDETIVKAIEDIDKENEKYLGIVVGEAGVALDGKRENVRAGETNLGNLLTDAMIAVSGADVALTNGGGIRATIEKGQITMGDILTSFPFTNYPVKLEVTGAELLSALEFGLDKAPEVVGKFPHVGGMTFKYDEKQEPGKRVFDVKVAGKDLDLKKTYTLVTNDFMAGGGDGYEMLKGKKQLAQYPLLSEVLADYIRDKKVVNPTVEGRIVKAEKPAEPGKEKPAVKFTDIKGHWAENVIVSVAEKGLFKGINETTFAPNEKVSRAMVVATLARIEGQDTASDRKNTFKDVKDDAWYANAVKWAAANNIVKGYDDGTFKPDQSVTREEMAAIISRYLHFKKVDDSKPNPTIAFADEAKIGTWALDSVHHVKNMGIIQGKADNLFDPQASTTRGELAQVISGLVSLTNSSKAEEKKVEEKKAEDKKVNDKKVDDKKVEEKKAA